MSIARKIIRYPRYIIKDAIFRANILSRRSIEDRFTAIYQTNYWGCKESVSGRGSNLEYTRNLRNKLPQVFAALSINTVFDAPCGDFGWMRHVVEETDIDYIGGDIVLPLVNSLNTQFRSPNVLFMHIDLTQGTFPRADMMICRDCLYHLSYSDTRKVLENFIASEIPYLLTTTQARASGSENKDIRTGDYRLIDLFAAPYGFPKDVALRIEDWMPEHEREMCLWSREQVIEACSRFLTGEVSEDTEAAAGIRAGELTTS